MPVQEGIQASTRGDRDVYAAVFSQNGQLLAAVGDDFRLRIWRVGTWELVLDQQMTRRALYAVEFAPGGRQVILGGEDTLLYRVDAPQGW